MVDHFLVITPTLVTAITTIITIATWRQWLLQRLAVIIGHGVLLLIALWLLVIVNQQGMIVMYIGGWYPPYGIVMVIDRLSAMMVMLTALISFCVALFSCGDINKTQMKSGFYQAYSASVMGLCGAFASGDLFNLYVWFEVTMVASFVLLASGGNKIQLAGTIKYLMSNVVATLLLLMAIALLYGITGTLTLADMATRLALVPSPMLVTAIGALLVIALAIKSALFPFFFWLPASYHTPSFSTSAIFAGLLSTLGVYALMRVMTLLFSHNHYLHQLLLVMALSTLIIGILGALSQHNLRRILSFTAVSHIGYMVLGIAIDTPWAMLGSLFYLIQHVIVKTSLFMMAGTIKYYHNAPSDNIYNKGQHKPSYWPQASLKPSATCHHLAIVLLPLVLMLAGFPPSCGFWGKLTLITATIKAHYYLSTMIVVLVSLLSLCVMTRVYTKVFWHEHHFMAQTTMMANHRLWLLLLPSGILLIVISIISLYPLPLFSIVNTINQQLLHPQQYLHIIRA